MISSKHRQTASRETIRALRRVVRIRSGGPMWRVAFLAAIPGVWLNTVTTPKADAPADGSIREATMDRSGPYLEIRPAGHANAKLVVLRLVNGGKTPIVVDRELVFLVNVAPLYDPGAKVHAELGMPIENKRPRRQGWRERFVELKPGEGISRRLDLDAGWRHLVYSRLARTRDGGHMPGPSYEAICRPRGSGEFQGVRVMYAPLLGFGLALRTYTGFTPNELRLYQGPLAAEWRVPGAPSSPKSPKNGNDGLDGARTNKH